MKLAKIRTGYVGLGTGTCFAESGNHVICVDNGQWKVALRSGVRESQIIFVAVGTPQRPDGSADLSNVWVVMDAVYEPEQMTREGFPYYSLGRPSAVDEESAVESDAQFACTLAPNPMW